MEFAKQYLLIAVIFVAIDAVWLTLVAKKFYQDQLGGMLKKKADLLPAAIFYVLYVLGMVVFALRPALANGSLGQAAGAAALLGLLMYATYDLTNLSTLKNWPWKVTVVDMVWGAFVTAASVTVAFLFLH